MTVALIMISLTGLGFAGAALTLAIRQAGIREDRARLALNNAQLQTENESARDEIARWKRIRDAEVKALETKLRSIRERLDQLPDSAATRELLRGEFSELLSGEKTEDDPDPGSSSD